MICINRGLGLLDAWGSFGHLNPHDNLFQRSPNGDFGSFKEVFWQSLIGIHMTTLGGLSLPQLLPCPFLASYKDWLHDSKRRSSFTLVCLALDDTWIIEQLVLMYWTNFLGGLEEPKKFHPSVGLLFTRVFHPGYIKWAYLFFAWDASFCGGISMTYPPKVSPEGIQ